MKPRFLLWSFALLLGCELCGLGFAADASARPNILLAIGDNWAWPHAGALGDPVVHTPVFDRIAREGVLFNHVFCPVPSCSPTRSSLLTGRAAHQLEDAASLWSAFPRKLKVFTDMLRDAGYEVGSAGKGWSPGRFKEYGWEENPAGKQYASFDEFMAKRDPAKPFFFWHGNVDTALHRWRYGPEGAPGLDAKRVVVPPMLPDAPDVRADMLAYYGGAERMDTVFGDAMSLIEKAGALDNTVVIYTSDNGWQMPRGLGNCYDTGTRVPLAIRWGNRLQAGRKVDDFISLTDFAPTFLELAGLKPTPEMTGRSFADVLLGKPSAAPRDQVFIERERHANVRRGDLSYPIRGIRTKDFLYLWNLRPDRWPAGDPKVYYSVGDYGDVDGCRAKDYILVHQAEPEMKRFYELNFAKRPAEELFDLRKDPHQLVNVAGRPEHAASKRELRARVERWMHDTADPRVDPNYDGWDKFPYFGGRVVDENGKLIPKSKAMKK
jgi:arylsulfatase A-like enzyme